MAFIASWRCTDTWGAVTPRCRGRTWWRSTRPWKNSGGIPFAQTKEPRRDRTHYGGDNPEEDRKITYKELHEEVCKLANVLKDRGVKKGDRVSLYLPMVPEAAVAMLACTRIGAVHSIVFGGFSPDALKDRINDADCKCVITSDQSMRGGKKSTRHCTRSTKAAWRGRSRRGTRAPRGCPRATGPTASRRPAATRAPARARRRRLRRLGGR